MHKSSSLLAGVVLSWLALSSFATAQSTGGSGLGSSGLGGSGLGSSGLGGSGLGSGLGGSGLGSSGSGLGGSGLGSSGTTNSFIGSSTATSSPTPLLNGSSNNTTSSRGATSSGIPSVGNTGPAGGYYGNPLSIGDPNSTGKLTFATALYNLQTTNSTQNSSSGVGTISTVTGQVSGNSIGVRRAPAYTTTLAFPYQPAPMDRVRTDLQQLIARSSRLASRETIRVETENGAVVLRGMVTDDREKRLAEALARLTPGVRNLRNELDVRNPAAPSLVP